MSSARSTVLGAMLLSDTTQHVLATCPAGYTCLVKDIAVFNAGANAATVQVGVYRAATGPVWLIAGSVQGHTPQNWAGWVALEPGDLVLGITSVANVGVWVSGTVLVGQAPPT